MCFFFRKKADGGNPSVLLTLLVFVSSDHEMGPEKGGFMDHDDAARSSVTPPTGPGGGVQGGWPAPVSAEGVGPQGKCLGQFRAYRCRIAQKLCCSSGQTLWAWWVVVPLRWACVMTARAPAPFTRTFTLL